MGFTVRTLSLKAEKALAKVIEKRRFINTKTKAIEFVLEELEYYERTAADHDKLKKEHQVLKDEIYEIKSTYKRFNKLIKA